MSLPIERLENEVLRLSQGDRARLAQFILVSLEEDSFNEEPQAVEEAWAVEVERRVVELRSGAVRPIPGDEVFKEVEDLTK
jgi:putative addiction module component (TIGR02574 family)